ncbi:hypothetical protein ABIC37_006047 [Priestia megaterium]|uniref:hypothetical protein n=1 Tax=Priestia megaterium TaxID=1404 RepID=UPI003397E432
MDKKVEKYGTNTLVTVTETLPNNNKKITSKLYKSSFTDKYDDIKLRYVLFPKKELTLKEFFEVIVGDRFNQKKDYMMEVYRDYKQIRHCKSIKELMKYAKWAHHFIPNTFYKWQDRTVENIRCIQWMFFDFELRKSDGRAFSPVEVYEIFVQTVGFAPTIIKQTKTPGNYHVGLKHTTLNGSTESSYLFKRIQRKIVETIGTDEGAVGANHNFSIPKDGQRIFYFGDNTIDFNELKQWWIERITEENGKTKTKVRTKGKVVSLTEHLVWQHQAVQALMNHDYGDESRNHAAFTLALLFYALGEPEAEAKSYLLNEWFPFAPVRDQPFHISEVKASIRSAFSGRYAGPSKEWIQALTDIEFNLRIYKGQYKREVLHTKNENQQAIISYFRQRGGQVEMIQKELIEDICRTQESPLGKKFSPDSIKRNLRMLKKDGVVDWETVKSGKHTSNKITFTLKDGIQTENQTIIEEDHRVYVLGEIVN